MARHTKETMEGILFLLLTPVTIYIACKRPHWFWATWVIVPLIFETLGLLHASEASFSYGNIFLGPITVRPSDQAVLAIIIAGAIHIRKHGYGDLVRKPGGIVLLCFLIFLILKTAFSVLLAGDKILENRVASHVGGGLVAALGEARDNLVAFFPPFYAYLIRESRNLRKLGWPVVVSLIALLINWAGGVITFGHIWTGNINPMRRPINAFNAIDLTLLGILLLFLDVPRVPRWATRTLAVISLAVSILANHRSQWLAFVAASAMLLLILLVGRPMTKRALLSHVSVAGLAAMLISGICALNFLPADVMKNPVLDDLTIRFYAFTNPSEDPDSKWRKELWHDRVRQVGDNWPWGRPFGARAETLLFGQWVDVPDHSAYVSGYELGGVILCVLYATFFGWMFLIGARQLLREKDPEQLWPPAVALSIMAATLAFGGAYLFPEMGPAWVVILLLRTRAPEARRVRLPLPYVPADALPHA